MKQLHFSIQIQAPKETVWKTLWQDATFREWAGIIDPGTYMRGELRQGNEVEFISAENGYGVTSLVEKVLPEEALVLRHRADTQDAGARERDEQWTGGTESYRLEEQEGVTTLTVSFGVPSEMEEYFVTTYPKALEKVKELSEH